jgi:hypothetical protein
MRFGEDSFSKKTGQEEEERIPRNKVALFGLWLRRVPERLRGGRDERQEAKMKQPMPLSDGKRRKPSFTDEDLLTRWSAIRFG